MKTIGVRVIIFVVVLLLSTLACSTLSPGNLPAASAPLLKDDFSDNSSGWGTGTDAASSVEYADGGLKMIVYQSHFVTWSTPDANVYENVHIETSVKNDSADPQALWGIVCNEQASTASFYYVGVSSDGYYAFITSADGQKDVYIQEGNSDVIASAPNPMRLGLDCGNGSLTLYVNGQKIDSVTDSTYTSGGVGIFAGNSEQENGATITFDDFVMTKLGQ